MNSPVQTVRRRRFSIYAFFVMLVSLLFISPLSVVPWLFSVTYWSLGIPFLGYLYNTYDDILHPAGPLLILTFLYTISSILFYYSSGGITMYGDAISERSFIILCFSSILGALGIITGVKLAGSARDTIEAYAYVSPVLMKTAIQIIILLAIFAGALSYQKILPFFDFLHPKAYAETALSSRVAMMEAGADAPIVQVFTQIIPLVLILAAGIYLVFKRNVFFRILGGSILIANLMAFLLSGSRSGMFSTLSAIALYYHYRVRKITASVMFLAIIASVFLLNSISIARSTSNFSEMLDLVLFETKENQINLLDIGSSGELLVGLNMMKLIEAISNEESTFNYGKGFIDDILCYVPRIVYPNRPLPLSERFVEEFYPGVRDMGGGYGLFFLQDGYWAFGLIGVYISLLAYSWAISRIYFKAKLYFKADFIVLLYAFIYFPLVIASPRSGLLLSFKAAAMSMLPFFVSLLLGAVLLTLMRKKVAI